MYEIFFQIFTVSQRSRAHSVSLMHPLCAHTLSFFRSDHPVMLLIIILSRKFQNRSSTWIHPEDDFIADYCNSCCGCCPTTTQCQNFTQNRWTTCVHLSTSAEDFWKVKNLHNRQFLIGMFKMFTFTPQARASNSFVKTRPTTTTWWRLIDRPVLLPTAMWQSANLSLWKAMGDSSAVDDEAEGFRGTRGQRKETNIIHPL